jgi:hypothetical protein
LRDKSFWGCGAFLQKGPTSAIKKAPEIGGFFMEKEAALFVKGAAPQKLLKLRAFSIHMGS